METQTVNANVVQCLKEINEIGSTAVQNICTGSVAHVPWGVMDWVANLGLAVAFFFVFGIFIAMFAIIFSGLREMHR